eukprot:3935978-Rhodomonas_salina.2
MLSLSDIRGSLSSLSSLIIHHAIMIRSGSSSKWCDISTRPEHVPSNLLWKSLVSLHNDPRLMWCALGVGSGPGIPARKDSRAQTCRFRASCTSCTAAAPRHPTPTSPETTSQSHCSPASDDAQLCRNSI